MKISLKWLNQYVDVSEYMQKPKELAEVLTNAGLEVESIENLSTQFNNVVVGLILEKNQHPDADKLSLCQVTTGEGRVHQIVCGARNHQQGDRVVVALPGAVLPGNFAIKLSKIRGVESQGMLCSEKELGIAKESEGILILPKEATLGMPFAEYNDWNDITFELKVTPNRADCLSHFGLAREVACLLGREFSFPMQELHTASGSTKSKVSLEVQDSTGCPRYAGRYIRGVKVGPSPKWLKDSLERIGLNSINNVVDVTNYVMMELGQPLHAFDVREIKGGKIVVAKSTSGEKFTTLDGSELTLDGSELMIRDGERAVALAGVVGGKNSGVNDSTTELFIECAYFTPSTVRKASRKHGVETDSAYRFSRGVDPEGILLALNRTSQLVAEVAGGEIWGDHWDHYPEVRKPAKITLSVKSVASRLGFAIQDAAFEMWMKRLGCKIEKVGSDYMVEAPSWRPDLELDVDLVEEFARLYGYDKIPEAQPQSNLQSSFAPAQHNSMHQSMREVSRILRREGFLEACNYAFLSGKFQKAFLGDTTKLKACGVAASENVVKVVNPLNEDYDSMRVSLAPRLAQNLFHNARHGNSFGRLFEAGYVFSKEGESYFQEPRLGMIAWGSHAGLWQKENVPVVMQLKSYVENLLRSLGASSWRWDQDVEAPDFCHPNQFAALFFEGKKVGYVATLHPSLREEWKVREDAAICEFQLDSLMRGFPRALRTKPVPKFLAVERDLALVCAKDLTVGALQAEIEKAGGKTLTRVEAFDVFEGGTLGVDKKSVAFHLTFVDPEATLTEEVLTGLTKKIMEQVGAKLGAAVR